MDFATTVRDKKREHTGHWHRKPCPQLDHSGTRLEYELDMLSAEEKVAGTSFLFCSTLFVRLTLVLFVASKADFWGLVEVFDFLFEAVQ